MSVPAAYLGVILIWTTTPLAIKWSGEGPGFLFGVTGRMAIGAALCFALMQVARVRLPLHRVARWTYVAAGLAIYGSMITTYWGAQFIPSGLISVVFGLTPLVTGILAALWLDERSLTPSKFGGMLAGFAGLAVIFGFGLKLGPHARYGLGAVLVATVLHATSAVWVKRLGAQIPALAVTGGGLLFALPLYLATWLAFGGGWPQELPVKAAASIVYLGVFGSVLGFALYFYALRRLDAGRIALITLVTPVTALLLGGALNGERPGAQVWAGTALILAGLVLHQWGDILARVPRRGRAEALETESRETP